MLKGIILAGGTGSRLLPLTQVTNKHLLPVGDKPMIIHAVLKLVTAGISDIMVITGIEHAGDIFSLLGSGTKFGCTFTYKVQDAAGGIAQALGLCRDFVGDNSCVVILGDNIFTDPLTNYIGGWDDSKVLIKEVEDPSRFGVVEFNDAGGIKMIHEKPSDPPSQYAVTGIYFYNNYVFNVINSLKPSGRGELEITDVNNWYVSRGMMSTQVLDGAWTDAGTHDSLMRANLIANMIEY